MEDDLELLVFWSPPLSEYAVLSPKFNIYVNPHLPWVREQNGRKGGKMTVRARGLMGCCEMLLSGHDMAIVLKNSLKVPCFCIGCLESYTLLNKILSL